MQEGAKQGFPSGNTPPNGFSWSPVIRSTPSILTVIAEHLLSVTTRSSSRGGIAAGSSPGSLMLLSVALYRSFQSSLGTRHELTVIS